MYDMTQAILDFIVKICLCIAVIGLGINQGKLIRRIEKLEKEIKMFSIAQKREIAAVVEEKILSFGHPEMPKEKPKFKLHIDGKKSWSWADIEPNWVYDDKAPDINPWNGKQDPETGIPMKETNNADE